MCGRFTLTTPGDELAEAFGLDHAPALAPRYNIAPTQPVLAVRKVAPDAAPTLVSLRWGLIPAVAREPDRPLINARAETAATLPSFRDAFRSRRCLVPADGFYEWRADGKRKQPFHVHMRDGHAFAFAGLWEPATRGGDSSGSCVLLTTDPNDLLREIHDRMPAILRPADYDRWLDPAQGTPAALRPLLRPYAAEEMAAYRVGSAVNDARRDEPACIAPA